MKTTKMQSIERAPTARSFKKTALLLALTAVAFAGCGKEQAKKEKALTAAPVASTSALNSLNLAESVLKYSTKVVSPTPWVGFWFPYGNSGIYSAATKYDAAYLIDMKNHGQDTSKYESLAEWEARNHNAGVYKFEPWFGHCNGWSASAIMTPEPRVAKTINGVVFDVGDQKALLAESWLEFSGDFVGTRVNDKGDFSSAAFWDVVPAQFHLMLVNVVGKQNHALVLDRHTGHEIWNQPLAAYQIQPIKPEDYLGPHPQYPSIYRVNVTTKIWWGNDNVGENEVSPPFNLEAMKDTFYDTYYPGRVLKYELWLDGPMVFDEAGNVVSSGDILVTSENGRYVGGVWKNGSAPEGLLHSHPDYMWVPYGVQHSTGYKNPKIDDTWVRDNIAAELRTNRELQ